MFLICESVNWQVNMQGLCATFLNAFSFFLKNKTNTALSQRLSLISANFEMSYQLSFLLILYIGMLSLTANRLRLLDYSVIQSFSVALLQLDLKKEVWKYEKKISKAYTPFNKFLFPTFSEATTD